MFEYFPKINYNFDGLTLSVTNIFKKIELTFDRDDVLLSTQRIAGERPDQLSSRLYSNRPQYYWSFFLVNDIKNPLKEWTQSEESYLNQIKSEYDGWVYQFANTSAFNPDAGSTGFGATLIDHYYGIQLEDIQPGDLVIYETGNGPFCLNGYGAGGVTSDNLCGSPHYGQGIIPDNFDKQNQLTKITSGNYFNAALDVNGYIYVWGKDITLSNFNQNNRLYSSQNGGYQWISGAGNRLIAIDSGSNLVCFGECNSDFPVGQTNVKKASFLSGNTGGVIIKNDKSVVYFGITGPTGISMESVACGHDFCVGIVSSNLGLTAWGSYNFDQRNIPQGITGFTLIASGYRHAIALKNDGTIYSWGLSGDGQIDTTPTTSYTNISAGRSHTAAINSDGELVVWGKLTKYGESGCPGQTEEKITPITVSNTYSDISSGYHHILLKQSGTNKKYIGVVDNVDLNYQRIFIKTYQFGDLDEKIFTDPTGTVVSVWRYNETNQRFEQIKTLQHKLVAIQKYLNSTQYVKIGDQILDPTQNSNWENEYLLKFSNPENYEEVVTVQKQLLDYLVYKNSSIRQLSSDGVENLRLAVKDILSTGTTNKIKLSDL